MQQLAAKLDACQKELNEIQDRLGISRDETKQKKAAETRKKLSDKAEEARAKLMRGEKLTTEDILIMQGAEERK